MPSKKTVLIIFGKGGHTAEMLKLVNLLGSIYNYEYVIQNEDPLAKNKIKNKGRIFLVNNPRLYEENFLISFFRTLRTSLQAFFVLQKSKANAVISAGPGIGVVFCYLAKLSGKKIIFLEDWSRIYVPSVSGRLIYKVADLFFVQWPELKKHYPKVIYAGRLG